VGDSGSLTGAGLHFEVRYHGKPMNPLGWIKKS
jgi:murein hydrolase activator